MELISIKEFREAYFSPQSVPTSRAVLNWCKEGTLPAKQIGGKWYIDRQQFEAASDDALVEKILSA